MQWIDISRPLAPSTAVWPGDQPVEWSWTMQIDSGQSVNVGALLTSVHAATHADAPMHISNEGRTIDELPIESFIGPADVVSVSGSEVTVDDISDIQSRRVLFRTSASEVPTTQWPDQITSIHPVAVQSLAQRDVVLIGTDAPSIDPLDSTSLDAHHALAAHDIVHLEGLDLRSIAPGSYTLSALPIKISGADAAPVRAVLSPVEPSVSPSEASDR